MSSRWFMVLALVGLLIPIHLVAQDSTPPLQRVQQLEENVQQLRSDLRSLETRVSNLEALLQAQRLQERAGYTQEWDREKVRSVNTGMDHEQVRRILGPPHAEGTGSYQARQDTLTWRYRFRMNGQLRTLILLFQNGELIGKHIY